MTDAEIRAAGRAAISPAQRLIVALAAIHAARPGAIRQLTLEDLDLPNRRITIAGHRQRLGELTRNALLAWLGYRRATWPGTANRHVLISRISALGTGPVSLPPLPRQAPAARHLPRTHPPGPHPAGSPGHRRRPSAPCPGLQHDHTNAMAYANAARNLLSNPAEQAGLSRRPE